MINLFDTWLGDIGTTIKMDWNCQKVRLDLYDN